MRGWGGGGFGEHGGRGGHGHGRFGGRGRRRIFEQGEVRYVLLALLAEKPSYGYELIKAIEERLHGAYAPSPGLVYPTLTMLEEMGYATAASSEGGKNLYALTPQGRSFLKANRTVVDAIFGRMAEAAALEKRADAPPLVRAMENLKLTIRLKSSARELTDKQIRAMADALDEAARKIEQG